MSCCLSTFYQKLRPQYSSSDPNDTISPPTQDDSITLVSKVNAIRDAIQSKKKKNISLFDSKEQLKLMHLAFGFLPLGADLLDPKVASWMLQPEDKVRYIAIFVTCFP
jgi:hypothetical protein